MEIKTSPAVSTGPALAPQTASAAKDTKADDAKLKAACTDFEAVFLNLMLTQMRRTIPKSGLLGQSSQQDIMQSMLDGEMTKNMAQAGGAGLADMLYHQLTLANSNAANTPNKGQAPK
ncbi:MAG: rod-binding protein [Negativicutes bacterium]|nr:rod-binding protein [Negativicutes bacterium]